MKRVLAIIAGLLLVAPVAGFFLFLAEVQGSSGKKLEKADVIVALSGDPRRIEIAVDLLKKGFGSRLIIVGQDNQQEVELLHKSDPSLFTCCVQVDHSSKNTAQDAQLVSKLIGRRTINTILLVTSSFHLPRAKNELEHVLPNARIIGYGILDEFYQPARVFTNSDVASAFVRQYLMYIGSWIPADRRGSDRRGATGALRFFSSVTNLAVLAIILVTSIFLMFAAFKHRQRIGSRIGD
jgi:uncharacterized SAM-binding protein YcdF (DUF218 family)